MTNFENFQFLDSKGSRNQDNSMNSYAQSSSSNDSSTPYNFPSEENDTSSSSDGSDPFADFGAKIEVSDSELPF